jgi:beta-lactam-binding protein with PASTA domain
MLSIFKVFLDKRLYIGIFVIVIVTAASIFLADRYIMPIYTNHNTGVTVPDVTKLNVQQAKLNLNERGLRFEIIDERSNEAFPPDFVLDQNPAGNSMVKPNRKVYLTVNASEIPVVTVPNVVNLSLRNAEIQLQNFGLQIGNISYASSRFKNSVLSQSVPPGIQARRGTMVNLVISDGLGMNRVAVPEVTGMRLAEGQRKIRQAGLRVGEFTYQRTAQMEPGRILRFSPADADSLFEGESIDLIISELAKTEEAEERGAVIIDSTETEKSLPDSLLLRENRHDIDE